MKSTKCVSCGFVGWSDVENCKACGAPLGQRSHYQEWTEPESQKKGMAIFALILGILSFFTFGLLGVGAIAGIILACIAMGRAKREPWQYGGRGMAIAGLVLSITSLVATVPIGIIAAVAVPNLLAARRAANEASAIYTLRQISSAETMYYSNFNKYGTLDELTAQNLIDRKLGTGTKNGYKFTVELTNDEPNVEGFGAVGVPVTYGTTGVRSFYIDESAIMHAADHAGKPSSKMDEPLEVDSEFPSRSNRRVDYSRQPVY